MNAETLYTLASVIIVSLVSLIGVVSLAMKKNSKKILLLLVSLSAGTLMGGAMLHLLPEAVEEQGFTLAVSLAFLAGMVIFFIIERIVHAHHSHMEVEPQEGEAEHLGPLNIIGDAAHNFLDGIVIATAYMVNIPTGIAATIAVVIHEVPQEIADFGVLLYSGMSKAKALFFNFLSAAVAILGAIFALVLGSRVESFVGLALPFAAGGFVYIAGAGLIPELHKESDWKQSILELVLMLAGIGLMVALLFLE